MISDCFVSQTSLDVQLHPEWFYDQGIRPVDPNASDEPRTLMQEIHNRKIVGDPFLPPKLAVIASDMLTLSLFHSHFRR